MRRELRLPALKHGFVIKSVPNCCWYRALCETCMATPWPHTADRSVTGTAHLPSLSHINTRNIFCQYHFVYFIFVGRAGMDKGVACVCFHGPGITSMAELSHRLTWNKNNTAKFSGRDRDCKGVWWTGMHRNGVGRTQPKAEMYHSLDRTTSGHEGCENHSGRWRIPFEWSQCCTGTGNSSVSSPLFPPPQSIKSTPQSGQIKFIPGILVIHWHCKCYRSY